MNYRKPERERPVNKRILILCEGLKTEPNYFRGIRQDKLHSNRLSALQIVVHDTRTNTAKELIAEAVELKKEARWERNPYDSVWVVIDRDGYTKHPESFDRARATGINIAFSSPCFEYWILLHFEYTTAPFANCDEVISRLRQHIPGYEKAREHYDILKGRMETAIERGAKITAYQKKLEDNKLWTFNPYTDVGILVDKLLHLGIKK